MDRYETITRIPPGTIMPLSDVAQMLVNFIAECETEGMTSTACPAVMLLGAQLAFHCHADVGTEGFMPRLLQRCAEKAAEREMARRNAH